MLHVWRGQGRKHRVGWRCCDPQGGNGHGGGSSDDEKSDDSDASPQRPVFKAPRPRAGALSFKPQGKASKKRADEGEQDEDAPPVAFFGLGGGGKRGSSGYSRVSTG